MSSVTIKDIPDDLLQRVRARAVADKRSMNKEVIHLLEVSLSSDRTERSVQVRNQATAQVNAWSKLAGRWISDRDVADEIHDIYAGRTQGRDIDL